MMNDETVFHLALEKPPGERAALLDEACRQDSELRQRVERLLAEHERQESFILDTPPAGIDATAELHLSERPGTVIGPYKLLQQIGEGGMGVVFMAEQSEPLQRTVALKIIKPGMDTRQVIARFEAERQALAMMDHPNISRVLDAGTTDSGRPYFVMDLVKGVPITDYCDQQHLPVRQRLELMSSVCQAVQHAHQKGIIHRDLKPTNVLVAEYDGKPVPKVIDFGVAKATAQRLTEKTMFTELGQMVGTVEYMSPEQARFNQLDIDTRSDIYSLGVLLYELLTGSTPFARKRLYEAAFDEMLRIIREEEPPKPSTRLSTAEGLPSIAANRGLEPLKLNRLVQGELDWIVMKALEKDRNRRYDSANGLAADVRRYLADEAVQACPPSAAYRFRKFARRNKAALLIVSVILCFLTALGWCVGWAARDWAAREEQLTQERTARRAAIDGKADLALKEAEHLQEQGKWPAALSAVKQAEGVLAVGGSDAIRERAQQLRNDLTMVLRLEEFRTQRVSADKDYASQSAAYARLFAELGIDMENLTPTEIAARIARWPATVVPVAAALDDWAQVLRDWGLWERTRDPEIWKRVVEAARLADPDPWRSRLRQLVSQEDWTALRRLADASDMTELPVESLEQMGNALVFGGDGLAGVAWLREAHRHHPGDGLISFYLAFHLSHLPSVDWVEVLRFSEAALAARPNATMYEFVGNVLKELGKRDEAIASYRESVRLNPDDQVSRVYLKDMLRQVQLENAVAEYREAIRLEPSDALAHFHLGRALYDQQQLGEAIDSYLRSIELDPKHAATYTALGNAYRDQGKLEEAIALLRKGVELDPTSAHAHNDLGSSLYHQKNLDEAIACFEKAIELDPKFALAFARLGNALRDQGKLDEAIAAYRQSFMLESEIVGDAPKLGTILRTYEVWLSHFLVKRAWQLAAAGDPKLHDPGRAIELAQEAGALVPNWGHSLKTLGVAHYRAGHWQVAALALEEARQRYRKDSVILFYLSMAHGRLNQTEQARRFFDEAAQWRMGLGLTDEEMRRLCAEAATLLRIQVPLVFHEPPMLIPGPTLLTPTAGATVDNGSRDNSKPMVWDFDWSDVPGATKYHLYVFGTTEDQWSYNDPTLASSSFRGEQRGYTDNLHPGHHWKVRALVNGVWSDWSEQRSFTVAPLDDKLAAPK